MILRHPGDYIVVMDEKGDCYRATRPYGFPKVLRIRTRGRKTLVHDADLLAIRFWSLPRLQDRL